MPTVATCRDGSRRETLAALALSVLLHLLAITAVFLQLSHAPPETVPEEEPVRLTIVQPPVPVEKRFVRLPETPATPVAPDRETPFESDRDSVAASELPPEGTAPVPTTMGVDAPGLALRDMPYTEGPTETPSSRAKPQPEPAEPAAEAVPTPRPEVDSAPIAKPTPPPREAERPRERIDPAVASPGGYSPETRVTRLRGSVSNRGRSSVEAAATPLGRYKKMVSDAIGSRWHYHVRHRMGLLDLGTVEVRFTVLPDGTVKAPLVVSNTSNESFAAVCITSVVNAEIPPMPAEVAKVLDNGRLEIDYSFTILGNR
jgi:outer membrane biosynthesis protein TonB